MDFLNKQKSFLSTQSPLPKVAYVKMIDIYFGICLNLLFLALLEYVVVVYIAKKQEQAGQDLNEPVHLTYFAYFSALFKSHFLTFLGQFAVIT
jgi:hypothetical protein